MGNRYHSWFWCLFLRTGPNLLSIYFHQFLCRWIWVEPFISIRILFIRYVICWIFLLKTYGTRVHQLVALHIGRSMVLSSASKGLKRKGTGWGDWFRFVPTF